MSSGIDFASLCPEMHRMVLDYLPLEPSYALISKDIGGQFLKTITPEKLGKMIENFPEIEDKKSIVDFADVEMEKLGRVQGKFRNPAQKMTAFKQSYWISENTDHHVIFAIRDPNFQEHEVFEDSLVNFEDAFFSKKYFGEEFRINPAPILDSEQEEFLDKFTDAFQPPNAYPLWEDWRRKHSKNYIADTKNIRVALKEDKMETYMSLYIGEEDFMKLFGPSPQEMTYILSQKFLDSDLTIFVEGHDRLLDEDCDFISNFKEIRNFEKKFEFS